MRLQTIVALAFMLLMRMPDAQAQSRDTGFLETLVSGRTVDGFAVRCLYSGSAGRTIGARFQHARTGFVFDYFQIESVPQAFIYVNTLPTSDKGEPHTQEHLLLGKGNKGRAVADSEAMTLSASSAYTEPWRTCYFFNTTAGIAAFYDQLYGRLDALLHPDYTDEEVRREVRNFGVTSNPDGTLRLEEKGSVYNEMVSTMDKSGSQLYRALNADIYGSEHPLAYESGGTPEALRTLTPNEIRTFRERNYYPGNMGMVAAFPRADGLPTVLNAVNGILNRLQPGPNRADQPPVSVPTFPSPNPAASLEPQIVSFPDANPEQPGEIGLAWPADRKLSVTDTLLLSLFCDNLAGDADTPLYHRFIDSKTRTVDTGATQVYSYSPDEAGAPVYVGLSNVRASFLTPDGLAKVRQVVMSELDRIASWPDDAPQLREFNGRLHDRLLAWQRAQSKLINSPPGFGARFTSSAWMDTCRMLERAPGDRKSILLAPQCAEIAGRLASNKNLWRDLLREWKLAGVTPYAVGAKADPALPARQQAERAERAAAEVARLKQIYGTADDQATIRRYREEYDAETARQERIAQQADTRLHFLEHPPLTPDGSLHSRQTRIGPGIPLFAASFDTMTSATVRLSLRLDGVGQRDLVYLSALPSLMDSVGVVADGKPISYEEMAQRQRREILSVGCAFAQNPRTARHELTVTGAGNDTAEARRAVQWMRWLLTAPDWRPANLSRIRDVVDQRLNEARNRMLDQEEFWVRSVDVAWRYQNDPLTLATGCFLTQAHDLHRLRWMLKAAPTPADRTAFLGYLNHLSGAAQAAGSRTALEGLLRAMDDSAASDSRLPAALAPYVAAYSGLPAGAKPLAHDANGDLARMLNDLPDDSLMMDWAALCREMSADFMQGPERTLRQLDALRQRLLRAANARCALVGATATETALMPELTRLTAALTTARTSARPTLQRRPYIADRLRQRVGGAAPLFVGLVAPSMKGGTVMNTAPLTSYAMRDEESLLRYLAGGLYSGGGASSVFMKTWAAGLAYGNGIGASLADGTIGYYADHTPELPQTVRFVVETVKKSPHDPNLIEYALSHAFGSLESERYETRAFVGADELADGITPERVRAFRTQLLALRHRPDLADAVYARLPGVMQTILPGYGAPAGMTSDQTYVVIGPEKQLDTYESYLRRTEGAQTTLHRLYPRDFWLPAPAFTLDKPVKKTASVQRAMLPYAPAPADNPLKGLVPYANADQSRFPHSLEFDYLPLSALLVAPDTYRWEPLESLLNRIAGRGHQAIFRVFLEYPGKKEGIPSFLIDQGVRVFRYTNTNTQPLPSADVATPDYRDPRLRRALVGFIHALGRRYDGDPRIGFITAGLLGTWGEWHDYPRNDLFATKEVQREIMDAYTAAFAKTRILLRYPAGDNDPVYASNADRPFGYHDDSFAWSTLPTGKPGDDWFFVPKLQQAGQAALDKWQRLPIGGEIRPEAWGRVFDADPGLPAIQNFMRCVEQTHASWLMDTGMFQGSAPPERRDRALAAVQRMGYELTVAAVTCSVQPATLRIDVELVNRGVAPFYYDWPVEYLLLSADGQIQRQFEGKGRISGLLPGQPARVWQETFDLHGLPSGNYHLLMRVVNPLPNGKPLRFANKSQDSLRNGWLTLTSGLHLPGSSIIVPGSE